jgi:hypothetical protein
MSHVRTDVRLWVEVDGLTIDVDSCVCSYAMDSIPQATVSLASGANMQTSIQSLAHKLANRTTLQVPAKIFGQFATPSADDQQAVRLQGKFTLFEGYATTLGDGISATASTFTLELTHWLSDLSYGSAISARSHPMNPAQFSFNAAVPSLADAPGAGGKKNFGTITLAQSRITATSIAEDLWGQGILPWFLDLAAADRLNIPELELNDTPDARVKAALNRFDGDKLPMDLRSLNAQIAADTIAGDIANATLDSFSNSLLGMANTTLWDKLVGELGPTYMFSVIPGPTWAKVVPFVPGLREAWNPSDDNPLTIPSRDYQELQTTSQLRRLLAAVGLVGDLNFLAGGQGNPNVQSSQLSLVGKYVPSKEGQVVFRNLPRWLANANVPFRHGARAAGAAGHEIATMIHPAAGEAPAEDPEQLAQPVEDLADALARTLYVYDVLRGRTGRIAGPLRLDVSPGSTISYAGRRYLFADPDSTNVRYASVVGVHLLINAGAKQAVTILDLAHHRSASENREDRTSLARHPLYQQVWKGDYLAKELR